MDNIFIELIKRTQNIQAKYCERINSLNKEIEQLLLDMQKIDELYHKKKKHSKEDESKAKKDAEKLKRLLKDIEKRCQDSSSSSSSGSSSSSSGSSCSTDNSSSNSSSNDDSTSNCSSSTKVDNSSSSGNKLSSPNKNIKKQKSKAKDTSVSEASYNDSEDNSEDSQKSSEKGDISSSSKDDKSSKSDSSSSESSSDQVQDGFFEFLFNKYKKNPVEAGLIQITGNSFDEYEKDLLPNIVDAKWDQNHWLSKNIANACITIDFDHYMVKVKKYRIRVGCSNGLGRFSSWEIEGTTKDNKKIILDKVLNCADITQDHPEVTISIKNDLFIRSLKIMMRGKNTDNNYKMRFRNIEIYGDVKEDK